MHKIHNYHSYTVFRMALDPIISESESESDCESAAESQDSSSSDSDSSFKKYIPGIKKCSGKKL